MSHSIIDDALNFFSRYKGQGKQNYNRYTLQQVGNVVPVWAQTDNLWDLYGKVPELQAVINRKAKMIASAKPIVTDLYGVEVEDNGHWIFDLVNRPNAMLSWSRMIEMVAISQAVTSNALIYSPIKAMGVRPLMLPIAWNNVKVYTNKMGFEQLDKSGIISHFEIPINNRGEFKRFEVDEIVYLHDNDGMNLFDTNSKIHALKYPLTNIIKSYEKRNVILNNMFSLGILTAELGDGVASQALDGEDIKDMRKDIKKRHKDEIIITDKAFKWQPMSFPTKDLMLYEENQADFVRIIDTYGLNENMFSNVLGKSSTFSNVQWGEKQAYNSTIIPETEQTYQEICNDLNLEKEGYKIVPIFDHISILQEDNEKHERAKKNKAERLSIMLRDGVITVEEYRDEMEN